MDSSLSISPVAPFNIFQRLVRQWDQLHPYNAAQVLKIQGEPDFQRLEQQWHEGLDRLGLGCVHVNGRGYHHECMNGQASTHGVGRLPAGTTLAQHISAELNRPFDHRDPVPFRPFVIQEEGAYWMGLVYQHWVADSASIRLLLREWFVRVHDPAAAMSRPVRVPDAGYWKLFGPERAHWRLVEGILSSFRWGIRFRRVRRIEGKRFGNFTTQFLLKEIDDGLIADLRPAARACGATVNDVFLAAIAEACNRHVPAQRTSRRQDLALGTIVDLRPYISEDLSDVFGLFLGFTSVICRPGHLGDWDTLLRSIAAQSAQHKESGVPQASIVRMLAGLAAGKFLEREKVIGFYRKRVPLAGGISNVNLNGTWASEYHPQFIEDYVRVSPTGPMMPLVFTATTLGKRLNMALSYRQAVVPDCRAERILEEVTDRLRQFARGQ